MKAVVRCRKPPSGDRLGGRAAKCSRDERKIIEKRRPLAAASGLVRNAQQEGWVDCRQQPRRVWRVSLHSAAMVTNAKAAAEQRVRRRHAEANDHGGLHGGDLGL